MSAQLRVEHGITSGTFSLDGEIHPVDNNVWLIGDDRECVLIDAPHDVDAIVDLVGNRVLVAILCTHAHDDHVRCAPEVRERTGARIYLHPDDRPLWDMTHPASRWDADLADGQQILVGGSAINVLHTPGHTPGSVCFHLPELGAVFTGDTLFKGGAGATGRSFSDAELLVESIKREVLTLAADTVVHTGHGPDTSVGVERPGICGG